MAGSDVCIAIRDAVKEFQAPEGNRLTAVDHVSLDVQKNEFVSIVGPSGCGKTTLLRAVQGLDTLTSGTITVNGKEPGDGVTGFVFQRASLLPWKTVAENVQFGMSLSVLKGSGHVPTDKAGVNERVSKLLELTGLGRFGSYFPRQISGGMQQRVNLARALAINPEVLLMDEPFSAVDAQTRERLQRDLQLILQESGTATLFITHDIREAVFQSDRVVLMSPSPGRVVEVFTIDEPRPRGEKFQQSTALAVKSKEVWEALHSVAGVAKQPV